MRRCISALLAVVILFSLSSCGGSQTKREKNDTEPVKTEQTDGGTIETLPEETAGDEKEEDDRTEEVTYDKNDLDSILNALEAEINEAIEKVEKKGKAVLSLLDSYEDYKIYKDEVDEFYSSSLEDARTLYAIIDSISLDYFKAVAAGGLDDYKTWDRAMDDYYDAWDDGLDDYYDAWDDMFDDVYYRCDHIIDDAYDGLVYEEYWNVWYVMEDAFWDAWIAMDGAFWDAWSEGDRQYWNVWSGFYRGNADVDSIIAGTAETEPAGTKPMETEPAGTEPTEVVPVETAPAETKPAETAPAETRPAETVPAETVPAETEPAETEPDTDSPSSGIRPEIKEAMENFEAFYREYVDFMKIYSQSDNTISMLLDYLALLQQLEELENTMEQLELEGMSTEEELYCIEVTMRVLAMMEELE